MFVHHVYRVPMKTRSRHEITYNCNYIWLKDTMTVLGIESGSSGKCPGPLATEPTLSYTMFLKNITLPPVLKNDCMHCT